MKKRLRLIAGVLCVAMIGSSCTKTPVNDGEQRETVINKTGEEANENQSKLDVIRPLAYSSVENLQLEPGAYISVIGRSSGDSYWKEVEKGAKRAVADMNAMLGYKGEEKIRLNFSAPSKKDNVDEQINILDEELARYPVAVGIAAADATACQVQFDLATANDDIPIVTFDSGSEYQGIVASCSTNNLEAAKTAATKLSSAIEDYGEVAVFVQDSKSMTAKEREKGFLDEIKASYPDISVVNIYHMDELETMAAQIADEKNAGKTENEPKVEATSISQTDVAKYILEKYPNLRGVYATNLDTTQLVADAAKAMNREKLKIIGFDGGTEQMKLIKDGTVEGLIVQNPYGMGYATVVAAARAVLEMGNEAVIDSGYTWVTKDNMKKDTIKKMLY